ncbi:hypothetical protein ACFRCG_05110 [Embleya sp. NPDC056575]|uniref:hypothetical protein n=1 Tax=unclassified Embleya TaxID=2699296 RepID=UPI0036CD5BFD
MDFSTRLGPDAEPGWELVADLDRSGRAYVRKDGVLVGRVERYDDSTGGHAAGAASE